MRNLGRFGDMFSGEALNRLNTMIEMLEVHGKTIQDLVADGQLTEEQYAKLVTVINGHLKSGEVDRNDLNSTLRTEVDKIRNKIDKGEVSIYDINKNKGKFDQTYLTEELLQQIAGTASINAVPADGSLTTSKYAPKSVTASKLRVMKQTRNLFNGEYERQNINALGDLSKSDINNLGRVGIVPIEPNEEYIVKVHDPDISNRFRVATNNKIPESEDFDSNGLYKLNNLLYNNEPGREFAFKNNAIDRFLFVLISIDGSEPRLQVEKGSVPTEYVEGLKMDNKYLSIEKEPVHIQDLTFATPTRNLFDGHYHQGLLLYQSSTDELYPLSEYSGVDGNTAIIKVSPNTTYTIKIHEPEKSEVFRVGLWDGDEPPAFYSTMVTPLSKTIITSNSNIPKKDEVTFTTEATTNYVLIYVSNSNQKPKMQMEVGVEPSNYIGPYVINKEFIDIDLPGPRPIENVVDEFNVIGTLDAMTVDDLTGFYEDPNTVTPQEFHNDFISLVQSHSDIADYKLEGEDGHSNNLYSYEIKPQTMYISDFWNTKPDETNGEPLNIPKVIITSGIHGREKNSNYAVYHLVKKMLENQEDNALFTLLSNVHLVIVPLICPSGFIDNTYENRDGINLNRDFPPYGSVTQPESEIVKSVIDAHADAAFLIDFHNHGAHDDIIGYSLTDSKDMARITTNAYKYIGNRWQLKEPGFPQSRTYQFGYTSSANEGTVGKYAYDVLGMHSAIIETTRHANLWVENIAHGPKNTQIGVDLLLNVILGILQSRR